MSQLPLSLTNIFNKIESAVFKLWMLYFQSIPFSDNLLFLTRHGFHIKERRNLECLYVYNLIGRIDNLMINEVLRCYKSVPNHIYMHY